MPGNGHFMTFSLCPHPGLDSLFFCPSFFCQIAIAIVPRPFSGVLSFPQSGACGQGERGA